MTPQEKLDLCKTYKSWTDEKLVHATVIAHHEYRPEAIDIMLEELQGRGINQDEQEAILINAARLKTVNNRKEGDVLKPQTVTSILSSGWGKCFFALGIISFLIDIVTISFSNLLIGSSVGWGLVMLIIVLPAALLRNSGKAPINRSIAGIWCFIAFTIWFNLRELTIWLLFRQETKNFYTSLTFMSGMILCWRFLASGRGDTELK